MSIHPAGRFDGQAISDVVFSNASTGMPQAVVEFKTEHGMVLWIGFLSDKAAARTFEALALCGYDGSDESTVKKNFVSLDVETETYEGKPQSRVRWVNAVGGSIARFKPMDESGKALMRARFKAAQKAAAAGPGTAKAASANTTTPFDDIV